MFKIDSNMTIKMSKGDDVKFPLFLNQGTRINPIRYTFQGDDPLVTTYSINIKSVTVNKTTWKQYVTVKGSYTFIYDLDNTTWKLNGTAVVLTNYGITVVPMYLSQLQTGDTFTIVYPEGDGCKVYFSIYDIDTSSTDPVFTKEFNSSDDMWRGKFDAEEPNGDLKIELLHTDPLVDTTKTLADLPAGEYIYQIRGKLLDKFAPAGTLGYVYETLTNKLRFYYIDDNFSEREW